MILMKYHDLKFRFSYRMPHHINLKDVRKLKIQQFLSLINGVILPIFQKDFPIGLGCRGLFTEVHLQRV